MYEFLQRMTKRKRERESKKKIINSMCLETHFLYLLLFVYLANLFYMKMKNTFYSSMEIECEQENNYSR